VGQRRAVAGILLHVKEHEGGVELINVGCGLDLTIREIAEQVRQTVNFSGEVRWDTTKPEGTLRKLLDVTRLATMGWNPSIELKEGLRDVYTWYRQELSTAAI